MTDTEGPVLEVEHLTKRFARDLRKALFFAAQDIRADLRGRDGKLPPLREGEFSSLDDVSFTLDRGEAVAIVGANGAGKSTLLKILHGLIKPDGGEVRMHGRCGALELGSAFDQLLTGRENLLTQATIFGLPRSELGELTERVIDFAGIGDAIDAPVRHYSSGMAARLAFAVAAQLKPDILLVDEVLAVGDLSFQRKCIAHLLEFIDAGGALVLVSHSVHQVQAICRRGILLEKGKLTFDGDAVEAAARHLDNQRKAYVPGKIGVGVAPDPVAIDELLVVAPDGGEPNAEGPAEFIMRYTANDDYEAIIGVSIWTADQMVCVAGAVRPDPISIPPGPGEIRARIERLPLTAGGYTLGAMVVDKVTLQPLGTVGFRNAPRTLTVNEEVSLMGNGRAIMQQLTTLDVTWLG